ncbi:MAG: YifB family Mg chelatase-like AAA ATPase [Clostridiales Family XIII bacterium]|nr:YifB family Mg chelatase-like AAA ATPase [Clostridiales Family XIII bacterium]
MNAYIIKSIGLAGLNGFDVIVETSITNGLPAFVIVGLPDNSVQESRERVRAVIKNLGYEFPMRRILVNLAPADTRKEGSIYDLPIALAVLIASGQITPAAEDSVFAGELSLDGKLRPVAGMLPMALSARDSGAKALFAPKDSAAEASLARGLAVYAADHISEIIDHLNGAGEICPAEECQPLFSEAKGLDFSDIKGQAAARRAIEIAVSGAHNMLLSGTAGGGKSMMVKRIPSILPPMTMEEMIETTAIHSVAGLTSKSNPLVRQRPFRSPHHTISAAGAAGGGKTPKPGEMSLSHNGVLFLDEFPEFRRDVLESLRQPMEDGYVTITRANRSYKYPSGFMLVGAMNPCKCGWHGHPSGKCVCSEESIKNYMMRISGPILDRIDLFVNVPPVKYAELTSVSEAETSEKIRDRVVRTRELQMSRQGTTNSRLMGGLMKTYCGISREGELMMKSAYEKFSLSARAYSKIIKVARTIADMSGSPDIETEHLAEAIQYRRSGTLLV